MWQRRRKNRELNMSPERVAKKRKIRNGKNEDSKLRQLALAIQ